MLYHVTIDGKTVTVELGDGRVSVDGRDVADAQMLHAGATGVHHLIADGAAYTVLAGSPAPGTWDLHIGGRRLSAEIVDERSRAIRALTKRSGAASGPRPVKAPMPGLVVRVDVAEGDAVRAGQGVLIMEAMKMENELKADVSGVVARVLAQPGQAVEKGAILIEFAAVGSAGDSPVESADG